MLHASPTSLNATSKTKTKQSADAPRIFNSSGFIPRGIGVLLIVMALLIPTALPVMAQDTPVATPVFTPIPAEELADDIVDVTVQAAEGTANLFEDFMNRLIQTPRSEAVRLLMVLGGVILLVAGWRLYEFVALIAGFIIGASVAVALFGSDNAVLSTAAMLLGGIVGALLGYFLYYVAIFLIGAYIGIVLTNALASALLLTPVSSIALFIGGLLGGIVLVGLSFEFVILLSALVGAQMLTLGLGLDVAWTLILTVFGVIIQFLLVRSTRFDYRTRPRRAFRFYRT